jgi:cell fate (sporulation/competence/biofilm development) regulator YlbF (YheA/YmcA/DUF963 family)
MEKILKKANELGHLLNGSDIVKRFRSLAEKMEKDETARGILNELMDSTRIFQEKEAGGAPIEVDEKRTLAELQNKAKENSLVSEFLATQVYYVNLLTQINEAIANPQGDPPKESDIILPGDSKGIIL